MLAVAVSVLWIDVLPRSSSSEAIGHEPQDGSDYVVLLQSRPMNVELRQVSDVVAKGSATSVVDGAGAAGFDGQQLADQMHAVNSARIAVTAAGLPVEPAPALGVISFAETDAKGRASGRMPMRFTGGETDTLVVEYLRLGFSTINNAPSSVIVVSFLILIFLSALCFFAILRRDESNHSLLGGRSAAYSAFEDRTVHWSRGPSHTDLRTPSPMQVPQDPKKNVQKPPPSIVSQVSQPSVGKVATASPVAQKTLDSPLPSPSVPDISTASPSLTSPEGLHPRPESSGLDLSQPPSVLPEPLCAKLVLPACEASFAVPVHNLTDVCR